MRKESPPRVRVFLVVLILSIFIFTMLPVIAVASPSTERVPPVLLPTPIDEGLPVPTFPSGQTPVSVKNIYFHISGILSLPQIDAWGLASYGAEQIRDPSATYKISRADVTFINPLALSVIQAVVERAPDTKVQAPEDIESIFNKSNLEAAWANYTGGWEELNRHAEKDAFFINLELRLEGSTFLARLLARREQNWLVELRLVVPKNNPALLENLTDAIWPEYKLKVQGTTTPILWSSSDQTASYAVFYFPPRAIPTVTPGKSFTIELRIYTSGQSYLLIFYLSDQAAWVKPGRPRRRRAAKRSVITVPGDVF